MITKFDPPKGGAKGRGRVIALPESVTHLGATIRKHTALLRLLQETGTVIGGGSILASHWNDHRRSTDADLMMRASAFEAHEEQIKNLLKEIAGFEYDEIAVDGKCIVLAARGLKDSKGQKGDIEIVRDALGDSMRSAHTPRHGPHVGEIGIDAEARMYILGKKFDRLSRTDLERDHYDILWAAYNDRETLVETVTELIPVEAVQVIAMRAQEDPSVLFRNQTKRVLDPKAPKWKDVLGQVWQAVDKFTTEGGSKNIRLPKLAGAQRPGNPNIIGD